MRSPSVLSPLPILLMAVTACQDSEISSVGPGSLELAAPPGACDPWPECKDGDGGGEPTAPDRTVEISGGMTTGGSAEEVQVNTDNQRAFVITGNSVEAALDLAATEASFPGSCVTTGGGEADQLSHADLAGLMTDPNQTRKLTMRFFRRARDREDSQIGLIWSGDAPVGPIDLWIGSTPDLDLLSPSPAVVATESAPDASGCVTYEFTSGGVQLKHQHGKPSTHPHVVCPIAASDEVTLEVCPLPSP